MSKTLKEKKEYQNNDSKLKKRIRKQEKEKRQERKKRFVEVAKKIA